MLRSISSSTIGTILGAVRSVPIPARPIHVGAPPPAPPFITISREPGAGGVPAGRLFVQTINSENPSEPPWTYWDREIVEKIAADHHLSSRLVEGLEDRDHSWLGDFLSSLSFADSAEYCDDLKVYNRVKKTIHTLAEAGRVVIVGRGGAFITRDLPGGIHLRLVAPLKHRVAYIASYLGLTEKVAAAKIHEIEHNRRVFYKTFWPNHSLGPESFTVSINFAEVNEAAIVNILRDLVRQRVAQQAN